MSKSFTKSSKDRKLFFPLLFLLLAFFSLFSYFLLYPFCKYVWGSHDSYLIQKIAQKKPPTDALKCLCLSEMLGLSTDNKISLYHFNTKKAREQLLSYAIFKEAEIFKIKPNLLFLDYTLRQPIAYVGDFSNSAIDQEGTLFPFVPFFSPKVLPEVFFGKESFTFTENGLFGGFVAQQKMSILKTFLQKLSPYTLFYLDLSRLDAPTLGKQEIVAEIQENGQKFLVRFSPTHYADEIETYFLLRKKSKMVEQSAIIDLRIPEVAFVKPL